MSSKRTTGVSVLVEASIRDFLETRAVLVCCMYSLYLAAVVGGSRVVFAFVQGRGLAGVGSGTGIYDTQTVYSTCFISVIGDGVLSTWCVERKESWWLADGHRSPASHP